MSDRTYDFERDREGSTPAERASENVFDGWPEASLDDPPELGHEDTPSASEQPPATWQPAQPSPPEERSPAVPPVADEAAPPSWRTAAPEPEPERAWDEDDPDAGNVIDEPAGMMGVSEHAPGELSIPPGVPVLEGEPRGERRAVGIVVSRFNGDVTSRLLESALAELADRGVEHTSITVMPVPGAFELPIAAMALAKTRRFACIVALGCVIRGDTPHFDYVAAEAASGLQLAAIETGVPVAFGVLTLDRPDQAEARYDKGAEAVRTGLEMADVFAHLRAAASR
ncbi:MAG: 6,7-dimethyl-8-ribityllumazine synthase [Gaiellales bacterium]